MNRLVRVARLQAVALLAHHFILFNGNTSSCALMALDLVIFVLAFWLSLARPGPSSEMPATLGQPLPSGWVPVRFLGGFLAFLNLLGATFVLRDDFGWAFLAPKGLDALLHGAFAAAFLVVTCLVTPLGDIPWADRVGSALRHLGTGLAALALYSGLKAAGLQPPTAVLLTLGLALLLGAFGARGPVPRVVYVGGSEAETEPSWLKTVREAAAQEERNRLARDLHDSIKQQLFTIQIGAATLRERWQRDPPGALEALGHVEKGVRAAMTEARALLQQLRPHALSGGGLVEALREQCEALEFRTGAKVQLTLGETVPDGLLPRDTAETLFRMAQEGLNNAARHARPTEVSVFLGRQDDRLVLEIRDDGRGFEPEGAVSGMGLRNLRERAARLGADLVVTSGAGEGTIVRAEVPILEPATPAKPDTESWKILRKSILPARFSTWFLLLISLVSVGGPNRESESGAQWFDLIATLTVWLWLGYLRWGMPRRARARFPRLTPAELETLQRSIGPLLVAGGVYVLVKAVLNHLLPGGIGSPWFGILFTLSAGAGLGLGVITYWRESEPGGWLHGFARRLRRASPGAGILWFAGGAAVALPYLPYVVSRLESWAPVHALLGSLCLVAAVYLGLRVPRGVAEATRVPANPSRAESAPDASRSIVPGR